MNGQRIPRPTHLTTAELRERDLDMAALEADPRTAGAANRPAWIVERVLRDAGRR